MKKVPHIDSKKLRKDIAELIDIAPSREMYRIVLKAINDAMDELVEIREEIPDDDQTVKSMLRRWDKAFEEFGTREAYYYQAFIESEDRSEVDAPLFEADYEDYEFIHKPKWPDMETPWRLANELTTASIAADADQDFLDDLKRRFEVVIATFWDSARRQINIEKKKYESAIETEESDIDEDENPRVYGYWPLVAAGAAAVVAALGAAAGYATTRRDESGQYVQESQTDQYLKTAKKVGVGIAIGVVLALLLILRIRVNRS
jgi:hypothetical protein